MTPIKSIKAREILDSRGNPTIEVTIHTSSAIGIAAVPSGASTGTHEALELRDGGNRYHGLGVQKAIKNVQTIIAPKLKGINCQDQKKIDQLMIKLDNTENKSKLGANAILGVSLACARAAANDKKIPLYKYINTYFKTINKNTKMRLPLGFFNVINGGKHADNKLSIQEFMIVPKLNTFKENLRAASEIYHFLKKELKRLGNSTNVGDEGGFAPSKLESTAQALSILTKTIEQAGYKGKVNLALDCAASEFYQENSYLIDGKKITKEKLVNYYLKLIQDFPIISIEDPFQEDDFESFAELTKRTKIQIVADDLTVTNPQRINVAINNKSGTCLLLKLNQIGTLTEALEAAALAYKNGWKVMVSHRSGETEDTFIADLAVGIGCGMIKSGAPCRTERTCKYNQLLRIEEEI